MGVTSIEWTRGADGSPGHTVNPLRARLKSDPSRVGHYCEKPSPGCLNCYASAFQVRRGLPPFGGTHGRGLELVEPYLDVSKLEDVLRRRKPTVWFWADMTDMFGRWVTNEQIAACFAIMAATPWHTHQVLTKRAERLPEWFAWLDRESRGYAHGRRGKLSECLENVDLDLADRAWRAAVGEKERQNGGPPKSLGDAMAWPWPLPNVWIGVSAERRKEWDERTAALCKVPAAVRFVSAEPLLEDLGDVDCSGLDWIIAGGESGRGARPMHPEWPRNLRDQCAAVRVPFFFKQNGAWIPWTPAFPVARVRHVSSRDGKHGLAPGVVDGETRLRADTVPMVNVGKKAAGRELDGRTWDEMPGGGG